MSLLGFKHTTLEKEKKKETRQKEKKCYWPFDTFGDTKERENVDWASKVCRVQLPTFRRPRPHIHISSAWSMICRLFAKRIQQK